jgi:hypothetical protein
MARGILNEREMPTISIEILIQALWTNSSKNGLKLCKPHSSMPI